MQGFVLRLTAVNAAHVQRHGYVLDCGELGEQIVKLPDIPQFPAAEFSGCIFRELPQIDFGEVYVTFGSSIKNSQDVQQGTLAGTRFANDREHLTGADLKRQILKEHQLRIA